jgi:hypothetical protein
MISRKKEATADKLKEAQEELAQLQEEANKKAALVKSTGGSKVRKPFPFHCIVSVFHQLTRAVPHSHLMPPNSRF